MTNDSVPRPLPALPNPGVAPHSLARERLQLHYAARLLASTAEAFCEAAHDDSHSNLGIDADGSTLTTHALDTHGRAISLDLGPLELVWTLRGMERVRFGLVGQTMAAAYAWLNASKPHSAPTISEREFPDFPPHALGGAGAFVTGDPGRRVQLGRYFALGRWALDALADEIRSASPRRVWPHHFDLGTLIAMPDGSASIGLGLSPGDEHHDEPYFYASRYPWPDPLPVWTGPGNLHRSGFTAVVLTASEWQAVASDQAATVRAFVREAFAFAKTA